MVFCIEISIKYVKGNEELLALGELIISHWGKYRNNNSNAEEKTSCMDFFFNLQYNNLERYSLGYNPAYRNCWVNQLFVGLIYNFVGLFSGNFDLANEIDITSELLSRFEKKNWKKILKNKYRLLYSTSSKVDDIKKEELKVILNKSDLTPDDILGIIIFIQDEMNEDIVGAFKRRLPELKNLDTQQFVNYIVENNYGRLFVTTIRSIFRI